ncbi:glycine cleavage system transcriptional repressor [Agarivorans sp. TSD2052]|uniref:glycine cleavage system protein R n=1 Tax=Agarivorans sp. TSD2052 TaxID=2937286 RepID=UPI00200F1B25|nr:ACT domain-containing protein [Agarivorans sp. TSD2052]UPW19825.1 glycine cleavage system transcriptional repressor [Agarivorans sp. TSD2052]
MSQHLVVTALGTNRTGIVNELTQLVASCGCNIVDSRMALFGSEFTLIMLVSGSHNAIIQIENRLPASAQELQLLTVLKKTSRHELIDYSHSAVLQLSLPDTAGVISKITQFISDYKMNMVSLKSNLFSKDSVEMLHAEFEVKLSPEHQTIDIEQQFAELCIELGSEDFGLQFLSN